MLIAVPTTDLIIGLIRFRILFFCKKTKSLPLAPIAVKILVARSLGNKIATESGTIFPEMPNFSAPKIIIELSLKDLK